jgi:amidophosphoribosyltransferase
MGAFFGAASKREVALDVFFGVDYHSHLGTRRAGMVLWDGSEGFSREIHSIENTPFRTKFEKDLPGFKGNVGMGCISDSDPQPLLIR